MTTATRNGKPTKTTRKTATATESDEKGGIVTTSRSTATASVENNACSPVSGCDTKEGEGHNGNRSDNKEKARDQTQSNN